MGFLIFLDVRKETSRGGAMQIQAGKRVALIRFALSAGSPGEQDCKDTNPPTKLLNYHPMTL